MRIFLFDLHQLEHNNDKFVIQRRLLQGSLLEVICLGSFPSRIRRDHKFVVVMLQLMQIERKMRIDHDL